MTTTLEIKVWVKGGEDTRRPDYYIKIEDNEYAPLLVSSPPNLFRL